MRTPRSSTGARTRPRTCGASWRSATRRSAKPLRRMTSERVRGDPRARRARGRRYGAPQGGARQARRGDQAGLGGKEVRRVRARRGARGGGLARSADTEGQRGLVPPVHVDLEGGRALGVRVELHEGGHQVAALPARSLLGIWRPEREARARLCGFAYLRIEALRRVLVPRRAPSSPDPEPYREPRANARRELSNA